MTKNNFNIKLKRTQLEPFARLKLMGAVETFNAAEKDWKGQLEAMQELIQLSEKYFKQMTEDEENAEL